MAYGGNSDYSGRCPAGHGHDWSGSYNYYVDYGEPDDDEQEGWRWCRKCYCMCYAGNGPGYCPAGRRHDHRGSYRYYLPHD